MISPVSPFKSELDKELRKFEVVKDKKGFYWDSEGNLITETHPLYHLLQTTIDKVLNNEKEKDLANLGIFVDETGTLRDKQG